MWMGWGSNRDEKSSISSRSTVYGAETNSWPRANSSNFTGSGSSAGGPGLDHAHGRGRRHDPLQREAGPGEEVAVLGLRALASLEAAHDPEVQDLAQVRLVPLREDELAQQEKAVRSHRPPAVLEEREGPRLVPVVDDPGQDVGVATGGDLGEEVAADCLAPIEKVGLGQGLAADLGDVGLVEEDAAHDRVLLKDGADEPAVPGPHVDQRSDTGEVVGV